MVIIFIVIGDFFPNQSIIWTCPACSKNYKHRQSLQNHRKFECGVEKKFQCHICEKWFRYKGGLNCHLGTVHKVLPKLNNKQFT